MTSPKYILIETYGLKNIQDALISIGTGHNASSICHQFIFHIYDLMITERKIDSKPICIDLLCNVIQDWPEKSHEPLYPVQCILPNGVVMHPIAAYNMFSDRKWDREHPYGQARIRLYHWLCEQFKVNPEKVGYR